MTPLAPESTASVKRAAKLPACPECGQPFTPLGRGRTARVFCADRCKQAHANRCAARGKALVKVAMGWRVDRGTTPIAKHCFQEMTQMLDAWAAEDHAAGRMRAPDYARLVTDFNESNPAWSSRFFDRQGAKHRPEVEAE